MGNPFSAIINGIEHVAQDMESLVSKAASELESLGIAVTGDVGWLIKFLIEAQEDPVVVINQLSQRIVKMGGEIGSTLGTLASGIMTHGLMGFAQQKVTEALRPLTDGLPQSSKRGQAIANVHHTTLTTVKTKLDALTTSGNLADIGWQGPSADAMVTSFGNISGTINQMISAFENGGPQDKLNIVCGGALAGIVVVGGIVLVCEMIVTIIVAIPGLVTGPGDLAILGSGGALMAGTLEAMETLVGADLLAWLLGSILIYVITHPISFGSQHTGVPNNGPGGANTAQASASNLPLPGQAVSGGRVYIPPKSGHGQPVRKGKGFVDAKGNIWEWAPGGAQHGGPHWDVQHPDGSHTNVAPNGKVIGKDNFPNNDSLVP